MAKEVLTAEPLTLTPVPPVAVTVPLLKVTEPPLVRFWRFTVRPALLLLMSPL